MCCVSCDIWFSNKIVYGVYVMVYMVQQQNCVCCAFYDIYFDKKIVCCLSYDIQFVTKLYMLFILLYIFFNNKIVCAVHLAIYVSVTKLCAFCIQRYIIQQQNCVCCVSYGIQFNNKTVVHFIIYISINMIIFPKNIFIIFIVIIVI